MSRRGVSLIELMVTVGLFTLLSTAMFWIFKMGASSWHKADTQSDLLRDVQTSVRWVERDAEPSTFASLDKFEDADHVAFCLLSAVEPKSVNPEPQFILDPVSQLPVWQRYVIYHFDRPKAVFTMREIPVPAGTPPVPLANLSTYLGAPDERVLARHVSECGVLIQDGLLELTLTCSRYRYGRPDPETCRLRTVTRPRN